MKLVPAAVRQGWRPAGDADDEVVEARGRITDACGAGMGELADTLGDAGSDMRGVLTVVSAVIAEHSTNIESCIATFEATDGREAGEFHGLAR